MRLTQTVRQKVSNVPRLKLCDVRARHKAKTENIGGIKVRCVPVFDPLGPSFLHWSLSLGSPWSIETGFYQPADVFERARELLGVA